MCTYNRQRPDTIGSTDLSGATRKSLKLLGLSQILSHTQQSAISQLIFSFFFSLSSFFSLNLFVVKSTRKIFVYKNVCSTRSFSLRIKFMISKNPLCVIYIEAETKPKNTLAQLSSRKLIGS